MAKRTFSQSAKVVGVLTVISALASELLPLVQKENPKLKKKATHIVALITELKEEIMDVAGMLKKIKK